MAVTQDGKLRLQARPGQGSGTNAYLSFRGPGCLLPLQTPFSVQNSLLLGGTRTLGHGSLEPLLPMQLTLVGTSSNGFLACTHILCPLPGCSCWHQPSWQQGLFGEAERNLSVFTGKE